MTVIDSLKKDWRFMLVVFFLLSLWLILFARILMLQVIDVDGSVTFLQGQGEARAIRHVKIPAHRGMITDRHGEPLAVSTPVVSIYANPKILDLTETQLTDLASGLGLDKKPLTEKLSRYKNKQFVYFCLLFTQCVPCELLEAEPFASPKLYNALNLVGFTSPAPTDFFNRDCKYGNRCVGVTKYKCWPTALSML